MEAETPVSKSKTTGKIFLLRVDTFLGHLKTPFAPKPGFFIHDLAFVMLAGLQAYILWSDIRYCVLFMSTYSQIQAGLSATQEALSESHANISGEYVAMLAVNFIPILIDIFVAIQLWMFIRHTRFSWIILISTAWGALVAYMVIIITQSILTAGYAPKFQFNIASYTLQQLPWLLSYGFVIFLLSRKKIRVMHKINPRNFFLSPFYGLLWVIITQALVGIIANMLLKM